MKIIDKEWENDDFYTSIYYGPKHLSTSARMWDEGDGWRFSMSGVGTHVFRERGGGWYCDRGPDDNRYPCRAAALVALKLSQ
jgi:hypothetical protein